MIDVSAYQGRIDWRKVFDSGVRRAMIKLTEGTTYFDNLARENAVSARKAGIKVGFYHYAHPNNSPKLEANWFLSQIHKYGKNGDLPPALDLEETDGLSWEHLASWKANWFSRVDHVVHSLCIFYSYLDFYNHIKHTLNPHRPLWIADFTASKPIEINDRWFAWQYTSIGDINGIRGHVDFSRVLHPNAVKAIKMGEK